VKPRNAFYGAAMCEARARAELEGYGDAALGEWVEWTGVLHLRRRLTPAEAAPIGPVLDVRGTPEALTRFQALPARLRRALPAEALEHELGAARDL